MVEYGLLWQSMVYYVREWFIMVEYDYCGRVQFIVVEYGLL